MCMYFTKCWHNVRTATLKFFFTRLTLGGYSDAGCISCGMLLKRQTMNWQHTYDVFGVAKETCH